MMTREDTFKEIEQAFGFIPKWVEGMPDHLLFYEWGMYRDFMASDTTLPRKTKELIGLAVAGAMHCRYTSLFHMEAARTLGVTDDEMREALLMSGMTTGWSTYMNGLHYDYDLFKQEVGRIADYVSKSGRRERAA
jgi:AhpD family alkylhydroperoxidase